MIKRRPLPWSDSCFVCGDNNDLGLGVKFDVDGDRVVLETVLDVRYEGYPGHVHGGIVSALLDETIGWACSARAGRLFFTVELNVRFLKAVPAGQPIRVFGEATKAHAKLFRGHGWIENAEGVHLASAEGMFFPLAEGQHKHIVQHLKMEGRRAAPEDICPDTDAAIVKLR